MKRHVLLAQRTRTLAAILAAAAAAAVAPRDARAVGTLPIVFHVATDNGRPVVNDFFVRAHTLRANHAFSRLGVCFEAVEVRRLPQGTAGPATGRLVPLFRRALVPNAVNVFVVDEIQPGEFGASDAGAIASSYRAHSFGGYIVLGRVNSRWALPHELGHHLGLPHHPDRGNVMSTSLAPASGTGFTAAQAAVIRRGAARRVATVRAAGGAAPPCQPTLPPQAELEREGVDPPATPDATMHTTLDVRGAGGWTHYEGDVLVDRPHGRGVFTWSNGTRYEGEFVHGQRHGFGVLTQPDGAVYRGEFARGEPTGRGEYR